MFYSQTLFYLLLCQVLYHSNSTPTFSPGIKVSHIFRPQVKKKKKNGIVKICDFQAGALRCSIKPTPGVTYLIQCTANCQIFVLRNSKTVCISIVFIVTWVGHLQDHILASVKMLSIVLHLQMEKEKFEDTDSVQQLKFPSFSHGQSLHSFSPLALTRISKPTNKYFWELSYSFFIHAWVEIIMH